MGKRKARDIKYWKGDSIIVRSDEPVAAEAVKALDYAVEAANAAPYRHPSDTVVIMRSGDYTRQFYVLAPFDEALKTWGSANADDGLCGFLLAPNGGEGWRMAVRPSEIVAIIDYSEHTEPLDVRKAEHDVIGKPRIGNADD
jgi:hypothetical protein